MIADMNKESMKALTEYLTKAGLPYRLQVSNYTISVNSEFINMKFMKSVRSFRFFAAFTKIKTDVSKHKVPTIKKHDVEFFEHDFRYSRFTPEVTNIDLSNAYATILYNSGYITDKTFKYLSKLPKSERLGSIGMLASKKYVFKYDSKGELYKYDLIRGKYENFFFYCAKATQELMRDLKKLCGKNYLFTWVDSVYFTPDPAIKAIIEEYITLSGFKYSTDTLKDFHININDGKIKLSFSKDGEDTYFYIPPKSGEFSDYLASFLTNKNYHNENRNFRVSAKGSN